MKARILSVLLMLCLMLGCAGCGDSEDNPAATQPDNTPTQPVTPADPNQTALSVNSHEINAAELNYFYVDAINEYVNQYSSYLQWVGLDPTSPLSTQIRDKTSGATWADHFLDSAADSAKITYALFDAAVAAGHELSEDETSSMEQLYDNMELYAKYYGYQDTDTYLKAIYGELADAATYKAYYEVVLTASSYYAAYSEQLKGSYTDADLRQFEGDEGYKYNSYSYAYLYLDAEDYENEDALNQVIQTLVTAENNTTEKFNAAIEAIEKAQDPEKNSFTTATEINDQLYSKIDAVMQDWLRDSVRKDGDITSLRKTTITTGSDGKNVETLVGYYIVLFNGVNNNQYPLANIRHILAKFEGGTINSTTGQTIYSQDEKDKAKAEADKIYDEWLNGDKTEESFAELAKKYTDDGNGDVGGIYYDVYPGQMVQTFNDWCFDAREPGDHGIVETEYGYHVMFYSGDSKTTYRDYMVKGDKLSADIESWMDALYKATTMEIIDTGSVNKDYIISPSETKE